MFIHIISGSRFSFVSYFCIANQVRKNDIDECEIILSNSRFGAVLIAFCCLIVTLHLLLISLAFHSSFLFNVCLFCFL